MKISCLHFVEQPEAQNRANHVQKKKGRDRELASTK